MRKPITLAAAGLSAGMILYGLARAQQTAPPAATPQNPPAKSSTQTTKPGTGSSTTRKPAPAPLKLETPKAKTSYAYGLNMGEGMRKNSIDLDPAIIYRGIKDGLAGGKTLLTDEEAKAAITAFQADLRQKQQAKMQALAESNKKEGEEFLAANKAKEGVVTLPDGLQYKILQQGDGPKPAATDQVICNYKGTLLDNTEFDSSYKRGQPATFPVNGVIRGWSEALQLMPVGSKWQLFIPPDLGYGARGAGGTIGPNATLVFEVELLSIKPKTPPPAPNPPPGANPPPNPNAPPTPNPTPNPNAPNPKPNPTPPPNPNPTPTPNPTTTPTTRPNL
jgi:FKBP-type peptidyl-prolyl cis-trans isomerase FklB